MRSEIRRREELARQAKAWVNGATEYFEDFEAGDPAYERPMRSLVEYMDFRRFGVLPRAGGLRDQYPETLEDWRIIYQIEAEKQRKDAEKEKH